MSYGWHVLHKPATEPHACAIPGPTDYPLGTVIQCGKEGCGKRYELKHRTSQRSARGGYIAGGHKWVRRYWPWPR